MNEPQFCTVIDELIGKDACNEALATGWILLGVHTPPKADVRYIVGWPRRLGAEYPPS